MAQGWRIIAKTAAVTTTLTTVFWFAVAAWWYQHSVGTNDDRPSENATQSLRSPALPVKAVADPWLAIPVVGVRPGQLVDTFSQARARGARHHDAIDIMAPRGAMVIAAAPGRVEKLFLSKDGGNTVYIRSPDGLLLYYYAHLDSYDPSLVEGMPIERGASLGTVGSTGNADPAAPHLHFAIWRTSPNKKWWEDATALNPFPMLTRSQ